MIGTDLEYLLREEMHPILWFRSGMASVVPVEVLQNALDTIDMLMRIATLENAKVKIDWKQTFPFPDGRAATILAGLDY